MTEHRADEYQRAYLSDYGFERTMVRFRREMLLAKLREYAPRVVIEIGCGHELLYKSWRSAGHDVDCWIIAEPAAEFAAQAQHSGLPNLHVFPDYFENAVSGIMKTLPRPPDLVVCASVLHEVPSPHALLQSVGQVLNDRGVLHINVPNAQSLHRRLAVAMGLIPDTKVPSDRNRTLKQPRVYDMASLKQEARSAGFATASEGGYFLKPFTHAQMESVASVLGEALWEGLFRLGRELPELASEIFIDARWQGP